MPVRFSSITIEGSLHVGTTPNSVPIIFDGTGTDQTLPILFAGNGSTFFSNSIKTLPIEILPLDSTVFNSDDLSTVPIEIDSSGYIVFDADSVSVVPLTLF